MNFHRDRAQNPCRLSAGTNKKVALEIYQKKQMELSLGHFNIIPINNSKVISLSEVTKSFLDSKRNHIRPSSFKRYQNYMNKFTDYIGKFFPGPALNISEIKSSYVEESFNYFLENKITNGNKWESKTVNGLRAILIQLFNYAIKQGFILTNPIKDTTRFRENGRNIVEYFTDEELEKIWQELDEYWVDPLKFILHTGLRKGEWINLKWKNVRLTGDNPSITITSSGLAAI